MDLCVPKDGQILSYNIPVAAHIRASMHLLTN